MSSGSLEKFRAGAAEVFVDEEMNKIGRIAGVDLDVIVDSSNYLTSLRNRLELIELSLNDGFSIRLMLFD